MVSDTETIGSSIDLDQFHPVSGAQKKHDVVFLGRMHELKGVFDLPEVWAAVKAARTDATLKVIGEGPHRAAVMAEFSERNLNEGVEFTGGISEEDKNRLVSEARVGLSLSSEEGWGLAVNEYLASALPVVAYDLPVFREVFPGLLRSIPLGDKAATADAILDLLANPNAREEQGQAGREFVQRYDYRKMACQELQHLEKLCTS